MFIRPTCAVGQRRALCESALLFAPVHDPSGCALPFALDYVCSRAKQLSTSNSKRNKSFALRPTKRKHLRGDTTRPVAMARTPSVGALALCCGLLAAALCLAQAAPSESDAWKVHASLSVCGRATSRGGEFPGLDPSRELARATAVKRWCLSRAPTSPERGDAREAQLATRRIACCAGPDVLPLHTPKTHPPPPHPQHTHKKKAPGLVVAKFSVAAPPSLPRLNLALTLEEEAQKGLAGAVATVTQVRLRLLLCLWCVGNAAAAAAKHHAHATITPKKTLKDLVRRALGRRGGAAAAGADRDALTARCVCQRRHVGRRAAAARAARAQQR